MGEAEFQFCDLWALGVAAKDGGRSALLSEVSGLRVAVAVGEVGVADADGVRVGLVEVLGVGEAVSDGGALPDRVGGGGADGRRDCAASGDGADSAVVDASSGTLARMSSGRAPSREGLS